jgi:hypothetical protein
MWSLGSGFHTMRRAMGAPTRNVAPIAGRAIAKKRPKTRHCIVRMRINKAAGGNALHGVHQGAIRVHLVPCMECIAQDSIGIAVFMGSMAGYGQLVRRMGRAGPHS